MIGPVARMLPDGRRLHLQHGPIDLVIGIDGPNRARAFSAAIARFETILAELVDEQAILRAPPTDIRPSGAVARRMHRATARHAKAAFVTQMAAVAGAVADEVIGAIGAVGGVDRAFVNNGGDIALCLAKGQSFTLAMAGLDRGDLGRISIDSRQNIRGIATSGRGGRSLTMGIADSVTVLAASAAAADVAATLIANAVDLPGHRAVTRAPANQIDPASDLGLRPVVSGCDMLGPRDITLALENGMASARKMRRDGLLIGAALFLQGHCALLSIPTETHPGKLPEHA